MYYLLAIILINLMQGLFSHYNTGDAGWYAFDLTNQLTIILALCFAFSKISYKERDLKRVCFASILFFILCLCDYIITSLGASVWLNVLFMVVSLFMLYNCWFLTGKGIIKNPSKQQFLVYKAPTDFLSLCYSFLSKPFGHCFLVVSGKKFCYNKGVLVESEFLDKKEYLYKDLDYIPLKNARQMVGAKWSLFNNCFSTFERLESRAGERYNA